MMVGDDQMAASGQQLFSQMKQKERVINDPAVSAEVRCVVNNLLTVLPADWQSDRKSVV